MAGVKLPRAVQKQADEAERLLKEVNEGNLSISDPDYAQGGQQQDTDNNDDFSDTSDTTGTQPTPKSGEDDLDSRVNWKTEYDLVAEENKTLKQQLSTLQGKYNAEVPRLSDELRDMRREIQQLREGHQHQATQQTGNDAPQPSAAGIAGLDMGSVEELFGPEMVEALKAIKASAIQEVRTELEPRFKQVDDIRRNSEQEAVDSMIAAIAEKHSDWERIEGLPSWNKFLNEINPETGEPRGLAVSRASRRNDPGPIIRQLSIFKRKLNASSQALEAQTVPGNSGRTEPAQAQDTKIYSSEEINKFMKSAAQQASRGPLTDEQKRLEAQYTKAMLEGRVR